jgi:hypothetical protein
MKIQIKKGDPYKAEVKRGKNYIRCRLKEKGFLL